MNLKLCYDEAVRSGIHIYSDKDCEFLIYKGFKISKFESSYEIHDVRINDFYEDVSKKDLEMFDVHGFLKGADIICYERNKVRYVKYIKKLEKIYEKRTDFRCKYDENPKFYEKGLNNCEEGILKYTDLLFFYKAKILQHEFIYKIKQKFLDNE